MSNWLANTPLGTAFKTFLGVVIGAAVVDFTTTQDIAFDHWKMWVIAGLVSATPVVINYLNPSDSRYGVGAATPPAE